MNIAFLWTVTLCLASQRPDGRMRSTFALDLEEFRESLVMDMPEFSLPVEPEEVLHTWSPSNKIQWNPITCKQAGVEFKLVKQVFGSTKGEPGNKVYKAVNKKTGESCAYKEFGNSHDYVAETAFYMQAGHHSGLLRPICVQRVDDFDGKAHGGLLMEWFDGTDALAYANFDSVKYKDLVGLSTQVMETIAYIHSLGFVHADLKPGNVLVSKSSGQAKVIDFGFTTPVNSVQMYRGNDRIVAPELVGLVNGRIGFGADWWAFGVFVASIHGQRYSSLTQKFRKPYSPIRICHHGSGYAFGPIPNEEFSKAIRQVMHACFHPDPAMRSFAQPSSYELLRSLDYFSY